MEQNLTALSIFSYVLADIQAWHDSSTVFRTVCVVRWREPGHGFIGIQPGKRWKGLLLGGGCNGVSGVSAVPLGLSVGSQEVKGKYGFFFCSSPISVNFPKLISAPWNGQKSRALALIVKREKKIMIAHFREKRLGRSCDETWSLSGTRHHKITPCYP